MPWIREWQPTPVLLPGESHGGRSLVGYSPWRRKESNTTERLHFQASHQIVFVWLTSFGIRSSRSIHVVRKWQDLLLLYGWIIFHCLYIPDFLYSFICQWALRLFSRLVKILPWAWEYRYIFKIVISLPLNIYPGVELLDIWQLYF